MKLVNMYVYYCMIFAENTSCCVRLTLFPSASQSLVIPEKFQHILRVLNTNIDGRRKIAFAITAIKVSSSLRLCHLLQLFFIVTSVALCFL